MCWYRIGGCSCNFREKGLLTQEEYDKICHGLELYHLPLSVTGLSPEAILQATKKDKKMEQGQIKFILMDGLGKSFIDKTVTDQELLDGNPCYLQKRIMDVSYMNTLKNKPVQISKYPKVKGILLIVILVFVDQLTKYLAIHSLKDGSGIVLIQRRSEALLSGEPGNGVWTSSG